MLAVEAPSAAASSPAKCGVGGPCGCGISTTRTLRAGWPPGVDAAEASSTGSSSERYATSPAAAASLTLPLLPSGRLVVRRIRFTVRKTHGKLYGKV